MKSVLTVRGSCMRQSSTPLAPTSIVHVASLARKPSPGWNLQQRNNCGALADCLSVAAKPSSLLPALEF